MIIQCRKCWEVLWIDSKKQKKIKELDCPECWEESFENWIIIGDDNKKPLHNIDKLLKAQEENE
jgi:hypothetical protein